MKEIYSNINIIGGGLIGMASAYSLSNLGYKITLLEKNPKYNFSQKKITDYRTVAISEGTKNFLNKIGLWKDILHYTEPIKKIKVIDRKLSNKLEFDNERRSANLGYIIKNKELQKILFERIIKKSNIKIINNAEIYDINNSNEEIITTLENQKIISNLNIASDGKNSFIKKLYKTPFFFKDYKKSALVLTFNHSEDHQGVAYEFFYKNGPLAILPMKKEKNNFTSSIVWTNENHYLRSLINLDNSSLKEILSRETKFCVGKIKKVLSAQIFPLSAHINTRFFEKRTIYVGDSAHSFHPIAGQGWNLGMNDVENLNNLIIQYHSLGIELGDSFFCKKYHNDNYYNAFRLYQITDKLDKIFQIQNPLFYTGRSSGVKFIENNKRIKNIISDFAMGLN